MIETSLADMAESYNWKEVFGYACGENLQGMCGKPEVVPGSCCPNDCFRLEDVAVLLGSLDGDNDGPQWIAYGQLKDKRWFAVRAGCDYTGWD